MDLKVLQNTVSKTLRDCFHFVVVLSLCQRLDIWWLFIEFSQRVAQILCTCDFQISFGFLVLKQSGCIINLLFEGVVALWCNPLTSQPEQSGGVGFIPGRTPPLECHDKGSQT